MGDPAEVLNAIEGPNDVYRVSDKFRVIPVDTHLISFVFGCVYTHQERLWKAGCRRQSARDHSAGRLTAVRLRHGRGGRRSDRGDRHAFIIGNLGYWHRPTGY
jgi:hypothetical protein